MRAIKKFNSNGCLCFLCDQKMKKIEFGWENTEELSNEKDA